MTYFTPTVRYIFIYSFRMSCIPKQIQLLESHDGLSRLRPAHPCQQPTCRSSVSPARPSRKLQSATVWLMWHSWQVQLNICLIHISFAVLHLSTKKSIYWILFYSWHLGNLNISELFFVIKASGCAVWAIGRALIRNGGSSFVIKVVAL